MPRKSIDDKVAFTFRVDPTAYEKSKVIAKNELRSINSQIEYFVLLGVKQYEKEHGVIALSDEE